MLNERLSIAPMMDWTDPHYRMFMRGLTKKTVLYTEMVVDDTVIHIPPSCLDFHFGRSIDEDPSVIQLGGSEPEKLAKATEICNSYYGNYNEINLNCGCPSERVAKRCFGAKLMLQPELVREIVYSMQRRSSVPITVKCRIGADNKDSYADLVKFINSARSGGVQKFIVHARKCILKGLNTKQNRDIPPLRYEVVHQLVQDYPDLTFILNGGVHTFEDAKQHLDVERGYIFTPPRASEQSQVIFNFDNVKDLLLETNKSCGTGENGAVDLSDSLVKQNDSAVTDTLPVKRTSSGSAKSEKYSACKDLILSSESIDSHVGTINLPAVHGVMLGRVAYNNPLLFATADSEFYGVNDPCLSRRELFQRYIDYCEWVQTADDGFKGIYRDGKVKLVSTSILLNGMRNAVNGLPNCQKFRKALNDEYVSCLRGINAQPNPSCRDVIEAAMETIDDHVWDTRLGNPCAQENIVRKYPSISSAAVNSKEDKSAANAFVRIN